MQQDRFKLHNLTSNLSWQFIVLSTNHILTLKMFKTLPLNVCEISYNNLCHWSLLITNYQCCNSVFMEMKKNIFNFPLIILVLYIHDSLNIYIHCWLNREFHTYYTNIVMNRKKNRTLHAPFLCSNGFNGAKNAYFGISKVPLIYWWYTFIHLWM